jgi:hypothetical protein
LKNREVFYEKVIYVAGIKALNQTLFVNHLVLENNLKNTPLVILGVLEFHQQAFRADSMIKNEHKTLNTYRVKTA